MYNHTGKSRDLPYIPEGCSAGPDIHSMQWDFTISSLFSPSRANKLSFPRTTDLDYVDRMDRATFRRIRNNWVWKEWTAGQLFPVEKLTIPNEGISALFSLSGSAGWVIPEPSFLKRQHSVDLRGTMASCNVHHLTRVKVSPSQLKEIDHARCWFSPKAGENKCPAGYKVALS